MKWTLEKLQEEANKYSTRGEFCKANKSAYCMALKQNIIDVLFQNHINNGFYLKWTLEALQIEANKHKTRGDFWKNNPNAATTALNKNLMNELFKNHINEGYSDKQMKFGYWTEEKMQEEVNKYQTRKDFLKNSSAAHSVYGKKMIDELFKNHPNEGFIDVEEWKENSYIIYVYEIPDFNKAYVGLTNNVERRDKEHLFSFNEKLNIFCKENNIPVPEYKILEDNIKSTEVKNKEEYWIQKYKNIGWYMFNIAKAGSLGGYAKKWSKKSLQIEANKYKSINEFRKKNNSAYNCALRKKLIDELFQNHINKGLQKRRNNYWTIEKIKEQVDKYKDRKDFYLNNRSLYNLTLRKGLMNELFKNYPNKGYKIKKSE